MISVATFLVAELLGAALLALWVVVRFPRLGPGSMRPAVLVALAGLGVMKLAGLGAAFALMLPFGVWVVFFACALPGFFASLLTAAWLLRVCAGMMGRSGGGPGEPVTSRSY